MNSIFDRSSTLIAAGSILLAAWICLSGCGPYPPSAANRADIASLRADTQSLHARSLSDADIPALVRLQELTYLSFAAGHARKDITTGFKPWEAAITDRGLAELADLHLPKLDTLDLGHCEQITNEGILQVARMEHLQALLLDNTRITDDALVPILTMAGLRHLDLRGCQGITDRGLVLLETMTSLQAVCLGRCPNVTPAGMARLQAALPSAQVLTCEE